MYSNFIKFIFALTGFSPILFSYWIVGLIQNHDKLSFYLQISSGKLFYEGFVDILNRHWSLIVFVIIIFISRLLIKIAVNTLTIETINVKSVKSADFNFSPILLSYFLPWIRFYIDSNVEILFPAIIICCVVYSFIAKNSYHFNLTIRLFFGYRNYEIQTTNEISYLMLSRKGIINKNQVNKCVHLTDYMLLNVS